MTRQQSLEVLLQILVFMFGAGIGSFLNVVIYRLPLGVSVNNPRRSFCPSCKKQIPWFRNIPLLSWLLLRGKCAECGSKIAFRYFFVELLAACLFYAVFAKFGGDWEFIGNWGPVVLIFWIFTALLIAGTYIDIDHFILPHSITIGGLVVGLLGSYWQPQLMGETVPSRGIVMSFVSACIGLGLLWSVVELGKIAFGRIWYGQKSAWFLKLPSFVRWLVEKRKRMAGGFLDGPVLWSISQPDVEQSPVFKFGEREFRWDEIYSRESDRLILQCTKMTVYLKANSSVVEAHFDASKVEIKQNDMKVTSTSREERFNLEDVKKLEGTSTEIVIPREGMGFGDVLLLAMIGSFLGWKAVLFTVVAGSTLGTLFAVGPRLIKKTEWSAQIPFGPYLAAGGMIWLFYGPQFLEWYLTRLRWEQ